MSSESSNLRQSERQGPQLGLVRAPSAQESAKPRRLLSFEAVREKLDVSERQARYLVAEPWFPRPLELGPRCLRWIESEIDDALAERAPRRVEPAPEPQQLLRGKVERLKAGGAKA